MGLLGFSKGNVKVRFTRPLQVLLNMTLSYSKKDLVTVTVITFTKLFMVPFPIP